MKKTELKFVQADETPVKERKKNLRAYMRARRSEVVNRDVKEELLTENFFQAIERMGAGTYRSVFLYLSFSHEAGTDKLLQSLLEKGKTVYCPRVEGKEMEAVLYGEDLSLSAYGIREPLGKAFEGDIDVAVVPLLAVDERGNRLGYGGGYYDKYLSAHKNTLKIGYCYDEQIVRELPVDGNDVRMDAVVTDKRIVTLAKTKKENERYDV